jgi:chromosome segregation ATPase
LNNLETQIKDSEKEVQNKEIEISSLTSDITERKAALIKARQSAGEIEQIISDLKVHIDRLRNEES